MELLLPSSDVKRKEKKGEGKTSDYYRLERGSDENIKFPTLQAGGRRREAGGGGGGKVEAVVCARNSSCIARSVVPPSQSSSGRVGCYLRP